MADISTIKLPPLEGVTWKGDDIATPDPKTMTGEQREEKKDIKAELTALLGTVAIAVARLQANPTHASAKRMQEYEDVAQQANQILSALSGASPHILEALRSRSDAILSEFVFEEDMSDEETDGDYDDEQHKSLRFTPAQIEKAVQDDSMMNDLESIGKDLADLMAQNASLVATANTLAENSHADLMAAAAVAGLLAEGGDDKELQAMMKHVRDSMVESALGHGLAVSDVFMQERLSAIEMEGIEICSAMQAGPYVAKKRLIKAAEHCMELQLRQHRQEVLAYFSDAQSHITSHSHLATLATDSTAFYEGIKNTLSNFEASVAQIPDSSVSSSSTPIGKQEMESLVREMGIDHIFEASQNQALANVQETITKHQEIFHSLIEEIKENKQTLGELLAGHSDKGVHHLAEILGIEESQMIKHVAEFRDDHHVCQEKIGAKIREFNQEWKECYSTQHVRGNLNHS